MCKKKLDQVESNDPDAEESDDSEDTDSITTESSFQPTLMVLKSLTLLHVETYKCHVPVKFINDFINGQCCVLPEAAKLWPGNGNVHIKNNPIRNLMLE